MREFKNFAELRPLLGQEIAVSEWITVDQNRINLFAVINGFISMLSDQPKARLAPRLLTAF
jgi:hypothetical protein